MTSWLRTVISAHFLYKIKNKKEKKNKWPYKFAATVSNSFN